MVVHKADTARTTITNKAASNTASSKDMVGTLSFSVGTFAHRVLQVDSSMDNNRVATEDRRTRYELQRVRLQQD
jgi:hypothetical protein